MNRRLFLKRTLLGAGAWQLPIAPSSKHVILVVIGGGARKKDYLENDFLAPHIRRVAREGFVFEEDHCERVASHETALAELLQGRSFTADSRAYPTIVDYVGNGILIDSIGRIPLVL